MKLWIVRHEEGSYDTLREVTDEVFVVPDNFQEEDELIEEWKTEVKKLGKNYIGEFAEWLKRKNKFATVDFFERIVN